MDEEEAKDTVPFHLNLRALPGRNSGKYSGSPMGSTTSRFMMSQDSSSQLRNEARSSFSITGTQWRRDSNAADPDQMALSKYKKFVIPVRSRAEVKTDLVGPRKYTQSLFIDKKIKHLKNGGKLQTDGFQAGSPLNA